MLFAETVASGLRHTFRVQLRTEMRLHVFLPYLRHMCQMPIEYNFYYYHTKG